MGQYKVPQNVEAEDHILGPLTFKQFIYMMIGMGWGVISFAVFKSLPVVMVIVGGPPVLLFLLLAFFRRDGQDFEHLLVAIVGFFSATHFRLWVKEPLAETFHVTPTPKTQEVSQRNPAQVISELEKLATLVDSRGWNLPVTQQSARDTGSQLTMPTTTHQERIVAPAAPAPSEAPHTDMLDLQNSPLAQNLAELLQQSAEEVKQQAVQQMTNPGATPVYQPAAPITLPVITPPTAGVTHFAQPGATQLNPAPIQSISGVTAYPSSDILRLATQSEGMSVASVAAQATRINPVSVPVTNPNPQVSSGQTVEGTNAS